MLDDIRLALMERMRAKKAFVRQFVAGVAPRISQKLEEAYEEQKNCDCRWNGGDSRTGFEVLHYEIGHVVDLERKTCSCRSWDMTGIPCAHAMSAILYMNQQLEEYLAKWYTSSTYSATYSNLLNPVPGSTYWNHEGEGMVLPPDIVKRTRGKRQTARRRDPDEPNKNATKYIRRGLDNKCGNCGGVGHDRRNCPQPRQTQSKQSQQVISFL